LKNIYEIATELRQLQSNLVGEAVKNYEFDSLTGTVSLKDLFAGKNKLLVIHNMREACRYCTLWDDGINPFVSHLESILSVALLYKDSPYVQRDFANSRQWRMHMASHGGEEYMQDHVAAEGMGNMPGAVVHELQDDVIYRKAHTYFGPGDMYCSQWHFLGRAGIPLEDWTPQYSYWHRPKKMENGGANLL
jgi:predicted dithiol-disulfide oxidoreductase (DUF899 family)